jgi:alpha-mannosidase
MKKYRIHVIGQSHIDVAWFWPYDPETIYDCCKLTFTRAIDNLEKHEEYFFAQSQALLYETTEKYFPELFSKITKYVKEGRWDVVGGMYVEVEGAEPCGESLVRQCLFGQRYFREKFGIKVKVAWLPDTWTFPWQMPQILRKSGMNYLLFSRWGDGEKDILWWEAPDGSRVLAYKGWYYKYRFHYRPFPDLEELAYTLGQKYDVENFLVIIGSGDHGGGPTYQEIMNIKELANELKSQIEIKFNKPHIFFEELEKEAQTIPIVKDELGYAIGGALTTCAEIKKNNRLSENILLSAEKFSLIATVLTNDIYPQKELNGAWKKILFNQFHDIAGGCIIPAAQEYSNNLYKESIETGLNVLKNSLKTISSLVDTNVKGINIIVFNSLSWDRTDIVEVETEIPKNWKSFALIDPDGRKIPIQILETKEENNNFYIKFLFIAENVPSIGYKTYTIIPEENNIRYPNPIKITKEMIENDYFKIEISRITGYIERIFDKENNREIIKEPDKGNLLQLIEDVGDSEGFLIPPGEHTEEYVKKVKRMNKYLGNAWDIDSTPTIEILEYGPVRGKIRISRTVLGSTYTQEIIIYSQIKRVDFNLIVDWNERHKVLKVAFPIKIANPRLTFETQYGNITRQPNGQEQPMLQWVDISEFDGSFGVAILNDSKYGCDAKNNVIRLSILRSPTEPAYNIDKGLHEARYSLYTHKGNTWLVDVTRKGYEFNNKLIPIVEKPHRGALTCIGSFLSINPENLIITAIKKAEDSGDIILRLYEIMGRKTECKILFNFNRQIKSAYKTNLLEDEILGEAKIEQNEIEFLVDPYEIVTLKISFQ